MKLKFFAALIAFTFALAILSVAQDAAQKSADDTTGKPVPAATTTTPAGQSNEGKTPDMQPPPPAAKGTSANDADYVIGIEDVIGINVWHEPEMSRAMAVRPDGKISLPLIGEIEAEGKTPAQLQAELSKKLQEIIKNPDVTVIVQEIRSQKFNILGEVARPGMYPLAKPMTVLDALAVAGGFRDFAKPKKMYILRKSKDGSSAKIPVNYNNLIKGAGKNVELESRDTIVVP